MSGAPADVRRGPQFLAALVQHLLLGPAFHWSDERVLDLFLYRAQPLLSACRAALKMLNLAFQFPDPIFGSSQLKREPMRHGHRSLDVLFGDVSCFLQQTNHGAASPSMLQERERRRANVSAISGKRRVRSLPGRL